MKITISKPKFSFKFTKPIFTIKYSEIHQVFSTTNLFKAVWYYIRTLFTRDKYIEISDKKCSLLTRPNVCTIIIDESTKYLPLDTKDILSFNTDYSNDVFKNADISKNMMEIKQNKTIKYCP